MKLFRKNKPQLLSPRQEQLATRLAGRLTAGQRRAADWLNGRTAGLSPKAWLLWLGLLCLAAGGYCLYLLVAAFY